MNFQTKTIVGTGSVCEQCRKTSASSEKSNKDKWNLQGAKGLNLQLAAERLTHPLKTVNDVMILKTEPRLGLSFWPLLRSW